MYNNIKGLTPNVVHGWIDGLNFRAAGNITVNNSLTLGNDDTFATTGYNPSDEFPRRTYTENPSIDLDNTDANPAEIRHTFAAAGIYNADRLRWSEDDSENIRVNNAMGWTRTAHCIRAGSNLGYGYRSPEDDGTSLKSYHFYNFHSVAGSKAGGDIRFQNGRCPEWPRSRTYPFRIVLSGLLQADGSLWPQTAATSTASAMSLLRNIHFVKPIANPAPRNHRHLQPDYRRTPHRWQEDNIAWRNAGIPARNEAR